MIDRRTINANRARILALLLDEMPAWVRISKVEPVSCRDYPAQDDELPPFITWDDPEGPAHAEWLRLDVDFDEELPAALFVCDHYKATWEVAYEDDEGCTLLTESDDLVRALLLAKNRTRLASRRRASPPTRRRH